VAADRKATTPEDTTPECPPCGCTDLERENGHGHACAFGPLRYLPITSGLGPGKGSTRFVTIGVMNNNHTRYHVLRAVQS
jgi:hypothetical protein